MLVCRCATDIARCATESSGCVATGVECKEPTHGRGDHYGEFTSPVYAAHADDWPEMASEEITPGRQVTTDRIGRRHRLIDRPHAVTEE